MKPRTLALLYFAAVCIGMFVFDIHNAPKREQEIFAQWLMLGVLVILSYTGAINWRRHLDDIRHASDTPTSKIRSAAQGYVELQGTLAPEQGRPPLAAPLSRTACVWWEYEIWQHKRIVWRRKWMRIEHQRSEDGFCLADDTGQCRILPEGAEIIIQHKRKWKGRTRHPQEPDQRHRLLKSLFAGRYRYIEKLLLPGQALYALGDFRTEGGQHVLSKPDDERPFILSANAKSGAVNTARIKAARSAALCLGCGLGAALLLGGLLFR